MYKGQVFNGFACFLIVGFGYFFFVIPGIVFHILAVVDAASGDPTK